MSETTLESSLAHRRFTAFKTTVLVALGAYISGGLGVRAIFGALLATPEWRTLYYLNEGYDWWLEKGNRPKKRFFQTNFRLLLVIILLSLVLGPGAFVLMVAMAAFELVYTHPRWRLKRYSWAGPVLSGFIGPTLRLGLGVHLGANPATNWNIVMACWLILLAVHLPSAIKTRVFRRRRDQDLGYQAVSDRLARKLRPLQLLTPAGIVTMGLILDRLEQLGIVPQATTAFALAIAVTLTLATWALNDLHDAGQVKLSVIFLHDMWKGQFWTAQLEITASFFTFIAGPLITLPAPTLSMIVGGLLLLCRWRTYQI